MSNYLSKSRYCCAVQCPKMVWLRDHKPEKFDNSVLNQSILEAESKVGNLAMGLFGDYVEVAYGDLNDMIKQTNDLIKYVLPALFPNDPNLNYHNLVGVHNGEEASSTFEKMAEMSSKELDIARKQLLKYCGLNTYAMVKVWEVLKEI